MAMTNNKNIIKQFTFRLAGNWSLEMLPNMLKK